MLLVDVDWAAHRYLRETTVELTLRLQGVGGGDVAFVTHVLLYVLD